MRAYITNTGVLNGVRRTRGDTIPDTTINGQLCGSKKGDWHVTVFHVQSTNSTVSCGCLSTRDRFADKWGCADIEFGLCLKSNSEEIGFTHENIKNYLSRSEDTSLTHYSDGLISTRRTTLVPYVHTIRRMIIRWGGYKATGSEITYEGVKFVSLLFSRLHFSCFVILYFVKHCRKILLCYVSLK